MVDINGPESQYKAESNCLNIVLKKEYQTPAVKSALTKTTDNGSYDIVPSASCLPLDFTIVEPKTKTAMGGIEHFAIGLIYSNDGTIRISSKLQEEKGKEIYNQYHNNLEGNEADAAEALFKVALDDVHIVNAFDYDEFIKQFDRIMEKHLKKVNSYCDRIGCTPNKICFLIELSILDSTKWEVNYKGKTKKMDRNHFPFTKEFISVLKKAESSGIENVFLVLHDTWGNSNNKVLYFNVTNMEKSCKRQNIAVYDSFKLQRSKTVTNIKTVYKNKEANIYYSFTE